MMAKDKWAFQILGEKTDWEPFNHDNIMNQHINSAEARLAIKISCERFQNINNSQLSYSFSTNYQYLEKPWSEHITAGRWTHPGLHSNKLGEHVCNAKGDADWKLFKYDTLQQPLNVLQNTQVRLMAPSWTYVNHPRNPCYLYEECITAKMKC